MGRRHALPRMPAENRRQGTAPPHEGKLSTEISYLLITQRNWGAVTLNLRTYRPLSLMRYRSLLSLYRLTSVEEVS